MTEKLSLPPNLWPKVDREAWHGAATSPGFLGGSRPALTWSPKRRRIVEQSYGQWLAFLARRQALDVDVLPGDRAEPALVQAFVEELRERVSPWSVTMMVQAYQRMLAVLDPDRDWSWLRQVISNLKTVAAPSRDRRSHMVDAGELYRLGLDLLSEAQRWRLEGKYHASTLGRDGLMIAMLAACPVRIGNFFRIRLGKNLWFDEDRYCLSFEGDETKNDRPYDGELPPELSPWIDQYLDTHRVTLLSASVDESTDYLWVNRWGRPFGENGVRTQIELRTKAAFGRPIWPHLFRAISATGFVDHAPEEVGLVPDLLGHSDVGTAHKYYILSDGARAHRAITGSLATRRAAAMARLKGDQGAE